MTKAEIQYLMKSGFTLDEIRELDREPENAPQPSQELQEAPEEAKAEETPAEETEAPESAPAASHEDILAAEVAKLRETVKQLQAAALGALTQPGTGAGETIEDIVAKM